MLSPREKREKAEHMLISAGGALSENTRGRPRPEKECDIRTCFQRDVDRITHSKSFRRLKHKTQVFLQPEGDHYRTRLTHTLEVSRIARTISRALGLNEDLTEAIALGHDLGHTPFGHAGERALDEIFSQGFKHYEQSLRVVDRLEKNGRGLNLCFETRQGVLGHTTGGQEDTLEARVVRLSDTVAYINHDLDDAVRAGLLQAGDLPRVVRERIGNSHSQRINAIITDAICNSGETKIALSAPVEEAVTAFRDFMFEAVYRNPAAKSEETKVLDILKGIWEYYVNRPEKLPADYKEIADDEGIERSVCDYISGMTDKYAVFQYGEIFIPATWQVR